ncbi:MAG: rhodanese-like domain-containing protein [Gammaproteobacteria bacterium]|nr:rhodanese-like domain-containing protein [Gammaproteobacteria bacterium]
MNRLFVNTVPFLLSFIVSAPAFSADKPYSWKNIFPTLPQITAAELKQQQETVVLVDVRPKFEYEQHHKAGVKHISFSSRMFMLQMENLVNSNQGKTIVVYCESTNCVKSYRAVDKCHKAQLKNVVLFDLQEELAAAKQDAIYSQLNASQF